MTTLTLDRILLLVILLSTWTIQLHSVALPKFSLPRYPVENCPENKTAVEDASQRLNCSYGHNVFKNEYHCVPTSDLTQLVELCFDLSGRIERGICMVFDGNALNSRPCSDFMKGCPNSRYLSKEMYKFPACTRINRYHRCYLEDPDCPSATSEIQVTTLQTNTETPTSNGIEWIAMITTLQTNTETPTSNELKWISMIIIPIVGGICAIVIYVLRRRRSNQTYTGVPTEEQPTEREKEFGKRYRTYLEKGSVHISMISQVLIVGEHNVGKTTLLYHLQERKQKDFEAIKPTRGLDCYTDQHSFVVSTSTQNGETIYELKTNKQNINSLVPEPDVFKSNKELAERKPEENNENETDERKLEENNENETDERKPEENNENETDDKRDAENSMESDPASVDTIEDGMARMKGTSNKKEKKVLFKSKKKHKEEAIPVKYDEEREKTIIQIIEEGMEKRKIKLGNKNDSVLNALDFAGQGAYYATHQTYLRKDAIYIIVFDASKDPLKRKNNEKKIDKLHGERSLCDRPGVPFDDCCPKDFVEYWLNNIWIHCEGCENIIFLGTHKNQLRGKEFDFSVLLKGCKNLLPVDYYRCIEELKGEKVDLQKLKEHICTLVAKSRKEERPALWVEYDHILEIIKENFPVITIDILLKIVDHFNFDMSDIEVDDMLHFFHKRGKILYFNISNLREIVILDIQWFVDCFKNIISDRRHFQEDNRIVNKNDEIMREYYFKKGILEESLYEKMLGEKARNMFPEHRKILAEYQEKLGMMYHIQEYPMDEEFAIDENTTINGWYVPSINTQEFHPEEDQYVDQGSQILCFRFKKYLPWDLFGRLVVRCLLSENWEALDRHFYKDFANLHFRGKTRDHQVYFHVSGNIIYVQCIGQNFNVDTPGSVIRQEIFEIIQDLREEFYATSSTFEVGFLCNKKKGYKEDSKKHFVEPVRRFCDECKKRMLKFNDGEKFWGKMHHLHRVKNPSLTEETQVHVCAQVYVEVLKRFFHAIKADVVKDFGSYYISILKEDPSRISTSEWGNVPDPKKKSREDNMERIDMLIEAGQKLKILNEKMNRRSADKQEVEELKEIAQCIKRITVSSVLQEKDTDLRKHIFFLWTQKPGKITADTINEIPKVTLKSTQVEVGHKVTLEAQSDVAVHDYVWLRKGKEEENYMLMGKSPEYEFEDKPWEGKFCLHIRSFQKKHKGKYLIVVATKDVVGRKEYEL